MCAVVHMHSVSGKAGVISWAAKLTGPQCSRRQARISACPRVGTFASPQVGRSLGPQVHRSLRSSDPQILRSSDPQILRSSDPQILTFAGAPLREYAGLLVRISDGLYIPSPPGQKALSSQANIAGGALYVPVCFIPQLLRLQPSGGRSLSLKCDTSMLAGAHLSISACEYALFRYRGRPILLSA